MAKVAGIIAKSRSYYPETPKFLTILKPLDPCNLNPDPSFDVRHLHLPHYKRTQSEAFSGSATWPQSLLVVKHSVSVLVT